MRAKALTERIETTGFYHRARSGSSVDHAAGRNSHDASLCAVYKHSRRD
jgi:hypothetical protein